MLVEHCLAQPARASTSRRTPTALLLLSFSSDCCAVRFQNPLPPFLRLSEMGEIKEQKTLEEEPPNLPSPLLSKRKPDVDSATEDSDPSKKLKKSDLETPIVAPPENHNSTAEVAREDKGSNGSPGIDKGKAVMRDDKGKGKAKVEEEEEEEDSSSGSGDSSDDGLENGGGGDDDGDDSDDPLAEVDLDNILPSRTRRRAAEPGAYLVNDMDDDDDDDDVEEDAEDEDSE